jgi:catechol 2,3-dioxygenase-like lactoylglutathione lyase family enzyme
MTDPTSLVGGVDFITVPTRDYDKAAEFYGTVLGLPLSKRWGDMPAGEFETGTLTIAVMQSDAFGIEFQRHSHPDRPACRGRRSRARRAGGTGDHLRGRHDGQRRLPHGPLRGPRRQRADVPPPLRAEPA